jgi:hypothetical protein
MSSKWKIAEEAAIKEAVSVVGGRLSYLNKVISNDFNQLLAHSAAGCKEQGYGGYGEASYGSGKGMALEPDWYVFQLGRYILFDRCGRPHCRL